MLHDIITAALEQAGRSDPPVRVAALLRISRVQAAIDRDQARATFQRALDEIRPLGADHEHLFQTARSIAVDLAPDLLPEIPVIPRTPRIASLNQDITDFVAGWRKLPRDQAVELARKLVQQKIDESSEPVRAECKGGGVRFTSPRDQALFLMLPVLRQLDPALLDSLLSTHDQLAAAARHVPGWLDSAAKEPPPPPETATTRPGAGYTGHPRQSTPTIEQAIQQYRDDSSPVCPNLAPRDTWPSTYSFRTILYDAGRTLGEDAASYLNRVPDADIRLFAQIELAAALADLPELLGWQKRRTRPGIHQH